jgi:hypothetical protein
VGAFTDLVYVDAGGSNSATRSLSLTDVTIPANITAGAHLDVKSTVWTLGGSYRVVAAPEATFALLSAAAACISTAHQPPI